MAWSLYPASPAVKPAAPQQLSVGFWNAEACCAKIGPIGGPFSWVSPTQAPSSPEDEWLEAAFLARDEFALVAPRDHPMAGQGPLGGAEVCRYPRVLRSEVSGGRTAVGE